MEVRRLLALVFLALAGRRPQPQHSTTYRRPAGLGRRHIRRALEDAAVRRQRVAAGDRVTVRAGNYAGFYLNCRAA